MVDAEFTPDALARLARCQGYWQQKGFQAVSLPWIAKLPYTEATRPAGGQQQPALGPGHLVASGEQSFLQLAHEQRLPPGRAYVGWSPCVRQEAVFDETHHLYFMKVELFVPVGDESPLSQDEGLKAACEVLALSLEWNEQELAAQGVSAELLKVLNVAPNQWDIELAGVELGSYGVRQHFGVTYAYGTGCAEPRFSQALARAVRAVTG